MSSSERQTANVLTARRETAQTKIAEFSEALQRLPSVAGLPDLSIYATGSYGRLEASAASDLDLFFIWTPQAEARRARLDETIVQADIIKLAREHGFPEFSNDGQYLEVHVLPEMMAHIGDPEDDHENYFTARLLLLLESQPLANPRAYETVMQTVIKGYFRDFEDHDREFRPIYLINDIMRFWKTMCLNYESWRTAHGDASEKARVKNFKLKFSRLLTCYSMIIRLSGLVECSPEAVRALSKLSPTQRVAELRERHSSASDVISLYEWFLSETEDPERLHDRAKDETWRRDADGRSSAFNEAVFNLLMAEARPELLRYVVV